MLRTHGELGYKQEQRFHLELGLLKMAHAQKLIAHRATAERCGFRCAHLRLAKPQARPSIVGATHHIRKDAARTARLPPEFREPLRRRFSAQGYSAPAGFEPPAPNSGPRIVAQASQPEPVIMGSAAPVLRNATPLPSADEEDSSQLVCNRGRRCS